MIKGINLKDPNVQARAKQFVLVGLILIGMIILLSFAGVFSDDDDNGGVVPVSDDGVSISRIDDVDAEDFWLETAEGRIKRLEEEVQDALDRNDALLQRNEDLVIEKENLVKEFKQVIDGYSNVIDGFDGTGVVPGVTGGQLPVVEGVDPLTGGELDFVDDGIGDITGAGVSTAPAPLPEPITRLISFNLSPVSSTGNPVGFRPRDTTFWLPAGAHAEAVIISGVAAAVSAGEQGAARPVTMRVTSQAVSASDENGEVSKTDIRGCIIVGSARGDLSSERVYVRFQRMTCEREDGIIQSEVRGFVAGSGQVGVRGPVISREGDLVQKSFLAGFIGGFGNAASQALEPQVAVDGSGVATIIGDRGERLADAAEAGLARGVGTAGERLADYYIERAEQYQPIVNLAGGTEVEVVFLEGTWIDGRYVEPETVSNPTASNSNPQLGGGN